MTVAASVTAGSKRWRITTGKGEKAPAPMRVVPAMPTTWPHRLVPRPAAAAPLRFPFEQPGLRFRYFCKRRLIH